MNYRVYRVTVSIKDKYGKLQIRLLFPTAALRKAFCETHRDLCVNVGRRSILATEYDLAKTRSNLDFYPQLRDFLLTWDSQVEE